MTRPRLALTLGDPAGIGPEVVVQTLADASAMAEIDATVVGPAWALDRARAALPDSAEQPVFFSQDVSCPETSTPRVGAACAAGGAWAEATLRTAAELAESGAVDGIVTAPVSKVALHRAGYTDFVGHTEYFGRRVGVDDPTMFFWSPRLCVSLVTVHCPLRDVPHRLTTDRVVTTIARTLGVMRALGIERPRVGVCGLNPHAGEDGLFGDEDATVIAPAVHRFGEGPHRVAGPLAADTAFMRAGKREFDALVAMYHDQGLAPFKLVAFESGVNVTLGLPYVRTSVDHGTAFDIAGRGTADASSMKSAVRLAARLVHAARDAG